MRRIATCAAAMAAVVIAPVAQAQEERTLRTIYKSLYTKVEKKFGDGAAGRHIVEDGVDSKRGDRPARDAEIARSIRTMRNMLAPPPPVVQESSASVSPAAAPSGGGGAGGDLASIRQCESGGNYQTNTGNGYYGAYQFDQSTWEAAGGSGMPHTASPAEQDRVAANWIASGHRAAWPNC